jgi:hypothetical protein
MDLFDGTNRVVLSQIVALLRSAGIEPDDVYTTRGIPEDWQPITREDAQELVDALLSLEGYSESTELVPESELDEYAQEYAENTLGLTTYDWPLTCVDWRHAGQELAFELSEVVVSGESYYIVG